VARLFPRRASTRIPAAACAVSSLVLALAVAPAPSFGDRGHHLRDQRDRVTHQIKARQNDLDETSRRLLTAAARVDSGERALASARIELAAIGRDVAKAVAFDKVMQGRLRKAVYRLQIARHDLVEGRRTVVDQRRKVVGALVAEYQSGPDGLAIGFGLDTRSVRQAMTNLQSARTVLNKQDYQLQSYQATQVLLRLTATRVQRAKDVVAATRRRAAANLAFERRLEQRQRLATAQIKAHIVALRADQRSLAAAKRFEQARLRKLQSVRSSLDSQLRRLALERARRHRATISHHPTRSGGFLSFPVNGPITSPYGMRFHPILHIWELHDGTDFGVPCGTPVHAAASGRITQEYFNVAYGNRVIMDHGWVRGVSLQTSYNHLTSFVASIGQLVRRGQLIAYSGTTGWSTGCHLHFMVWVNGATVDPMTWL
jgi:murein DD-endopeptidase MepM/ murein hydrolase activator NlpD